VVEGDENMHRDSNPLSFVSQIFLVGLIVLISLSLTSILITVLGSNTVLAANNNQSWSASEDNVYNDPNAITDLGSSVMNGAHNSVISAGRKIYTNSQWLADSIGHAGTTVLHGSGAVLGGTVSGVAFVGRGLGSSIIFTLKLPIKVVGSIGHIPLLQKIVRPANSIKVPVINGQTSASVLARYNAEQQKQITKWLASQKVANQHLGGLIIAGDPNHGGYPQKWAIAPQDSSLDKWGMYNRECVSYAAWKVYQTFGYMPYWGGVGNANQWVGNAQAAGITTGYKPKVHSVAISLHGYYGHAAWVEDVKGNMIYVSQYNYDLAGHYSEMWVNKSNFMYIYF
jgi:surface antigen